MQLIITAITLGLLSSLHCIGMCGPIALALPVHRYSPIKKNLGIFLYNFGRIFTYTLLGMMFGLLGQSFFIGGFQQVVSITIGLLLLLSVTLPRFINIGANSFVYSFINTIKNNLAVLFNRNGLHFLFLIGLLNGLLPCGMVYLGIAGSIATGNFLKGAEFMLFFGLGTIPIMFSVSSFGQFISIKFRNTIRKTIPIMVSLMALMLIVRGLNLNIPYFSPAFKKQSNEMNCCETTNKNIKTIHCSPKK